MEVNPPIKSRTTNQLLEIIETKEEWRDDIVASAQIELQLRGINLEEQEKKRRVKLNYLKRIESLKNKATYSKKEKALIILLGPILVLLLSDIFLFSSEDGFKRKNNQGFICLIIGIIFWIICISIFADVTYIFFNF